MRLILLASWFLFGCLGAASQPHQVSLRYGLGPSRPLLENAFDRACFLTPTCINQQEPPIWYVGPVTGEYLYRAASRFDLGLGVSGFRFRDTDITTRSLTVRTESSLFLFGKVGFIWLEKGRFQLSSVAYAGIEHIRERGFFQETSANGTVATLMIREEMWENHIQLSPLSLRWAWHQAWQVHAEIGWGLLGMFQLGVTHKWEPPAKRLQAEP